MAAGAAPAILRRLAQLNRSSALAKPLQYSQVKAHLAKVSEDSALQILQDLEAEAFDVLDPVEWVKAAVGLLAGGGEPGEPDAFEDVEVAEEEEADDWLQGDDTSGPPPVPAAGAAGGRAATRPFPGVKQELRPAKRVKLEQGYGKGHGKGRGKGHGKGFGKGFGKPAFHAAKTEDLDETEKIERRVDWLNRNGGLSQPLHPAEVLPALDCIGFKQSMRVLRRLEEGASAVADPDEFIKDLVARSGWIWGRPDLIDDDEKVAKRVSWLNLFGGLREPIDYGQVADALDGLKVPHAMVLLRELEVNAQSVEDPTGHIRRTVGLAGEDEVHVDVVDEETSFGQRIAQLNAGASLPAPIEYASVAEGLARIGEPEAMQLLEEVSSKRPKDPTGFLKFKLKAKLAALGTTLEELQPEDEETKLLKRVEWLNDYGGLARDIEYDKVAARLASAGVDHAMIVLKELEDKRKTVQDPTDFILSALQATRQRAAARGARSAPPRAATQAGGADLQSLTSFVGFLNERGGKPVRFADVAGALDSLGPVKAQQILSEMQERGLGLDDPVTYIRAAAHRVRAAAVKQEEGEDVDDVTKLTRRLNWLNSFAGLAARIDVDAVVGALYCLGIPQSMAILRGLQEKGDSVADPTWYIKAAVQRANGVRVTPPPGATEQEAAEDGGVAEEDEATWTFEEEGDGGGAVEEGEAWDGYGGGDRAWAGGAEAAWADAGAEAWEDYDYDVVEDDEDLAQAAMEDVDDSEAAAADDAGAWGEAPWREGAQAQAPWAERVVAAAAEPRRRPAKTAAARRVVGGLTGAVGKLTPAQRMERAPHSVVKAEAQEEGEELGASEDAGPAAAAEPPSPLKLKPGFAISPQQKLVVVRDYALKCKLNLDPACLKALARIPFAKAKDMIDDVVLGGKERTGVNNPSRYLMTGCQRTMTGLGVEQGILMELAVSLGVVLNNDALDELACIPRKESTVIIRELARNPEVRKDALGFIGAEVLKCRSQQDARPAPFGR